MMFPEQRQLGPEMDNLWNLLRSVSVHAFGLAIDLKKSRFVPFGANLTRKEANTETPADEAGVTEEEPNGAA